MKSMVIRIISIRWVYVWFTCRGVVTFAGDHKGIGLWPCTARQPQYPGSGQWGSVVRSFARSLVRSFNLLINSCFKSFLLHFPYFFSLPVHHLSLLFLPLPSSHIINHHFYSTSCMPPAEHHDPDRFYPLSYLLFMCFAGRYWSSSVTLRRHTKGPPLMAFAGEASGLDPC